MDELNETRRPTPRTRVMVMTSSLVVMRTTSARRSFRLALTSADPPHAGQRRQKMA